MITVTYARETGGTIVAEWTAADGTRYVERYFSTESLQDDIDFTGAIVL